MLKNALKHILLAALFCPCLAAATLEEDDVPGDSSSTPTVLTLKQLLDSVRAHPEIKTDFLEIDNTAVDRNQALLKFSPYANVTQSWTSATDLGMLPPTQQQLNVGVNLFRGIQDFSAYQSSAYALEASREDRRKKFLESSELATEIYFTCIQLLKNENEARLALDIRRQIAAIEKARFEKGVRSRDDYTKLELDAHNAELDLKRIMSRRRVCLTQLSYWAGPVDKVAEITYENQVSQEINQASPNQDIAQHPILMSAMKTRDKSRWDVRRAQGAFLPSLDLTYAGLPRTDYQQPSHQWLLLAKFNLFDPGDPLKDIQKSKVAERIAEEREHFVRRQLEALVNQRREELRIGYTQYQGQKRNLELAQQLLASSLKRFRAGTLSANDVAFDQNRVVQSQFGFHDTWLQMNLTWLRYQAALGRSPADFEN